MKYGVTKDGFKRKTYRDVIGDMQNRAKQLFGEDIDVSERSPLGINLQNVGWEISNLWELAEDVYNSAFVDTAEFTSLDGVGKYITSKRKPARPSTGIITIEGSEGTKVNRGFRVSTKNTDIVFETTETGTIDTSGSLELPIKAIESGIDTNVPAMTITKIVNPISGVEKVYNEDIMTDGLDVETDKEFRERYYKSLSLGGASTREAVEAALLNFEDITDAFVDVNEEMEYVEGVPPKALAPYVFGGEDEDVANVILHSKAGGIRSFGSTEVLVADSKGIKHTIGFTRPTVREVYVNIDVSKGLGYSEDTEITKAILKYIGGVDENAIEYKGLKLGEDVVISKLIASVICLDGIKDVSVEVSTDNVDFMDTNIAIEKKEVARTTFDKVVINYV